MNYYGPNCQNECPGGHCNPCSNHGSCSEGISGSGICKQTQFKCENGFGGIDCSDCSNGLFGSNCDKNCPNSNGEV